MIVSNAIDCLAIDSTNMYIYIYTVACTRGGGGGGSIYTYIYISKRENRSILKQMIKS